MRALPVRRVDLMSGTQATRLHSPSGSFFWLATVLFQTRFQERWQGDGET